MLAACAQFSIRFRRPILIVATLLLPLMLYFSRGVFPMLRSGGFEDPERESWQVHNRFRDEMKLGSADVVAIYTSKNGENVDDVSALSDVLGAIERAKTIPGVIRVLSYYDTGAASFVNRDRTASFLVISLQGDDQARANISDKLCPLLAVAADASVTAQIGGITPVNQAVFRAISEDLTRAEMLAIPLTGLLMSFFFGSIVATLLPLLIGILSVAFALTVMRFLVEVTDVSIFAANAISIMGLGLAIDYSLFLVARFREEMAIHPDVNGAVIRTLQTTGRAVVFSGVTVAAGVCGLFVFPQMLLRSIAWGGLAVVAGAILLVLTVLPALLASLGKNVDAWRVPWAQKPADGAWWARFATAVMKRPVMVMIVVVTALLALAQPFSRLNAALPDYRILPAGDADRSIMERLDTEFLSNQSTSHDLLVELDVPVTSDEGLRRLLVLHRQLQRIPGIQAVESPLSVVDVVGEQRGLAMLRDGGKNDGNIAAMLEILTENNMVRVRLVSEHIFHAQASLDQVRALRSIPDEPGMRIGVTGVAAVLVDLLDVVMARLPWMLAIVFGAMFIVLFMAFGSVLLPIKAMIMNTLSITASFGALVYIFQDGRLTWLLQYEPLGISEATQPIVLFCIVFGLSMDYEVLLLSRVREEFDRSGDNEQSVTAGLVHTGRLITNAAAVLVLVVVCFLTSRILFMKTLGLGMALAVAVDATIVRAVLVPATMQLLGKWNWWAPAPLARLWRRYGGH